MNDSAMTTAWFLNAAPNNYDYFLDMLVARLQAKSADKETLLNTIKLLEYKIEENL